MQSQAYTWLCKILVKYNFLLQNMQNSSISGGMRCSNVPLCGFLLLAPGSSRVAGSGMWLLHERSPLLRLQVVIPFWYLSEKEEEWGLLCDTNPFVLPVSEQNTSGNKAIFADCMFRLVSLPAVWPRPGRWLGCMSATVMLWHVPWLRPEAPTSSVVSQGWCCPCRLTRSEGHKWLEENSHSSKGVSQSCVHSKTSTARWSSFVHLWSPCLQGLSSLLIQQSTFKTKPGVLSKFCSSFLNCSAFVPFSSAFWVLTSSSAITRGCADSPSHRSAGWSKSKVHRAVFL